MCECNHIFTSVSSCLFERSLNYLILVKGFVIKQTLFLFFFYSFNLIRPQNNGKFCSGSCRLNQLCNTRPCPLNAVDFRAQQCAAYNSKPFRGWYYKWKPYTKVDGKVIKWLKTQHVQSVLVLWCVLCINISENVRYFSCFLL